MSSWLKDNSVSLVKRNSFRANSIFPTNTRLRLLEVHLYLVKLFGGQLVDTDANIDLTPYRNALLNINANPNFYFAIGATDEAHKVIGRGNLEVWETQGKIVHARNIIYLGNIVVLLSHIEDGHAPKYVQYLWHPRQSTSKFKIVKGPPLSSSLIFK